MLIAKRSKVVFIGDSITDCSRVRPIGEGRENALGSGYVALVNAIVEATCPSADLRIVNMGVGGDTSRELKWRWKSDALDLRPDWISVMIGINDVWRRFHHRRNVTEDQVSLEEYEDTLDELVASANAAGIKVLLLSPFVIEENASDRMRMLTAAFGEAAKRVSARRGAMFVDIQRVFDRYLLDSYPSELSADRVHPNLTGHMLIARAWLAAVGFEPEPFSMKEGNTAL